MTRGREPKYDPEAGLPDPEAGLAGKVNPEAALSQNLRNSEAQLPSASAPGEKHSPMVMYNWVNSKVDLYRLPNQKAHENLLRGLVDKDNHGLRHKILHAMEVEEQAKKHGIKDYPVKVLLEEILSGLTE